MVPCLTCNVFSMRQFCRFFYCLAWLDTVEFNRPVCPDNEMYDNAVFADRFGYQLAMFDIRSLIGLYRLIHAHIVYEIDTAKIIAAFFRISYCLHDLIRLNSIVCHVKKQDVRLCGLRWSIPISIDYDWGEYTDRVISTPWYSFCIWNSYITNHHW